MTNGRKSGVFWKGGCLPTPNLTIVEAAKTNRWDTTMSEKEYWFPAKKYGWGWGLPSTWQGWVVYCVYFAR